MPNDANNNSESSSDETNDANASTDTSTVESEETVPSTMDVVSDILDTEEEGSKDDGENSSEESEDDNTDSDDENTDDDSDDENDDDSDENEDEDDEDSDDDEEDEDSEDEEEIKAEDFPEEFHKHERFKELINQKNEAREQVKELQVRVDDYQPIVNMHNAIGHENMQDFAEILILKERGTREDSIKAINMMKPMLQELMTNVGQTLEPDLQAKVDEGTLDEESARELQALRQENKAVKRNSDNDKETSKKDAHKTALNTAQSAANKWEEHKLTSDADYKRKKQFIDDRFLGVVSKLGKMPSAEEVVKILDKIDKDVSKSFKSMVPKKKKQKIINSGIKPKGKEKKDLKTTYQIVDDLI